MTGTDEYKPATGAYMLIPWIEPFKTCDFNIL